MRPHLLALLLAACATPPAPAPATRPTAPTSEEPVAVEAERDPLEAPTDVAAPPADARRVPPGLWTKLLRRGTGNAHPSSFSVVQVHYTGWTTDGKRFDSSHERGEPAEFPLNGVIAGWRHGLKLMVPGELRRFWIPEELAYKGMSGPQGMLVFDVELLEIVKP